MRILFCGGPLNGRWRNVDANALSGRRIIEVAEPQPTYSIGTGEIRKVEYRLWQVTLVGLPMWVAAPVKDHNEDVNVLRAVLQRDVADHLLGER